MQTTEMVVTVHKRVREESGQARRRVNLRRWFARLNGWAAERYALLALAGVALYKIGAACALRQRGYSAVGGEVLALLLPVVYYAIAATIRDIIKDWREWV